MQESCDARRVFFIQVLPTSPLMANLNPSTAPDFSVPISFIVAITFLTLAVEVSDIVGFSLLIH